MGKHYNYEKILTSKGWKDTEIKHAQDVLNQEKAHDAFFSKIVFYSALVIIIFANVFVSFAILFLSIVISSWFLYIITGVLALTIGFLYNFLITDIGHLEKKHHLFATILLPILAFANILLIGFVSNTIIADLGISTGEHNTWFLGVTFAVLFLVPAVIDTFILQKK